VRVRIHCERRATCRVIARYERRGAQRTRVTPTRRQTNMPVYFSLMRYVEMRFDARLLLITRGVILRRQRHVAYSGHVLCRQYAEIRATLPLERCRATLAPMAHRYDARCRRRALMLPLLRLDTHTRDDAIKMRQRIYSAQRIAHARYEDAQCGMIYARAHICARLRTRYERRRCRSAATSALRVRSRARGMRYARYSVASVVYERVAECYAMLRSCVLRYATYYARREFVVFALRRAPVFARMPCRALWRLLIFAAMPGV